MAGSESRLNDAQRQVAETFGRPIAAMAGAGSGKTFTMVRRILNAFDPQIVGDPDFVVDDIDQVLAITFTEKAAEELKSRIRAGLKSARRFEQALKVDAAWIGTIHGMCSRILRENALELGLDPAFSVLEEDVRNLLFDEVLERVLTDEPDTARDVETLLGEFHRANLKKAIERIVEKASQSLRGFDSLETCPTAKAPGESPEACLEDFDEVVSPFVTSRQRNGALETYLDDLKAFEGVAPLWHPLVRVARKVDEAFWESKRALGTLDQGDLLSKTVEALEEPDILNRYANRFRLVINDEFQDTDCLQFQIISRLSGEGLRRLCVVGDIKQSIYRFRGADLSLAAGFVERLRREDAATGQTSVFDLDTNYRSAAGVLDFVNEVFGEAGDGIDEPELPFAYDDIRHGRREPVGSLDFSDDAHGGPRIEVDEIQYTNGRAYAAATLAAARVAKRFREIHEGTGRPYGDMVVLLNTMTSAQLFADALDAEGISNAITGGSVFARRTTPMLLLDLVRLLANPLDGGPVAVTLSSEIFGFGPEDFRRLVDLAGIPVREDRGLPVGRALARLLGPKDPSTVISDTGRVGIAVNALRRAVALCGHEPPSRIVTNVLVDAGWLTRQEADDGSSTTGRPGYEEDDVIGGTHGMAAVADALKFIRMVRDLEEEGCLGFRDLARRMERRLRELKEAPGFLATKANDFVRIMTIHASKGLEFPVVAVYGLTMGMSRTLDGRCLLVSASRRIVGGRGGETGYDMTTYGMPFFDRSIEGAPGSERDRRTLSTSPGRNIIRAIHDFGCMERRQALGIDVSDRDSISRDSFRPNVLNAILGRAREHEDPCLWFGALRLYEADAEKAELMRKAYVAYTRAREALIVCLPVQVKMDDYRPIVNELNGVMDKKAKLGDVERLYAFLPDLRVECADNEVVARIQRRSGAIAALGAYRLVPFSRVNVWHDFGVWPPELGGEADSPDVGRPLVDEVPESHAGDDVLEELPPIRIPGGFVERAVTNRRYSPNWAEGILSASSIKEEEGETTYSLAEAASPSDDEEEVEAPAYEKGSAFHEICQLSALRWHKGERLSAPSAERVEAILRRYRLRENRRREVREALAIWFNSDIARDLTGYAHLDAEVPFFVPLDVATAGSEDGSIRFDGFIDLLGHDDSGGRAPHIVDYKTGTSQRTREQRENAYRTQAMVYAYAVMLQGHAMPRVTFVLVEQREGDRLATCEFPPAGETWTLEGLRDELLGKVRSLVPQGVS